MEKTEPTTSPSSTNKGRPVADECSNYGLVRAEISYDGTDYAGWQRQKFGADDPRPTIQATVEDILTRIFSQTIKIQGSGRTDAGAHADAQNFHFRLPKELKYEDLKNMNLSRSINGLAPSSIAVKSLWAAPPDFHALRSAELKTYRYVINNSPVRNPLKFRYSYWFRKPLDVDKLNALCSCLIGEHDFKSFQTSGTDIKTTVRRITRAEWVKDGEFLIFHVCGNGFLKQMVRNIVGTTLFLHQNGLGPDEMVRILKSRDRQQAKSTAPSKGLFLESVYYPPELDNRCREL